MAAAIIIQRNTPVSIPTLATHSCPANEAMRSSPGQPKQQKTSLIAGRTPQETPRRLGASRSFHGQWHDSQAQWQDPAQPSTDHTATRYTGVADRQEEQLESSPVREADNTHSMGALVRATVHEANARTAAHQRQSAPQQHRTDHTHLRAQTR